MFVNMNRTRSMLFLKPTVSELIFLLNTFTYCMFIFSYIIILHIYNVPTYYTNTKV